MSQKTQNDKSARPHDTPFKQQKLASWQPILTPRSVILTFVIIAVIFIPIGAGILASSNSVIAVGPIRYDQDSDSAQTFVSFTWPTTTTDNVYIYYQLSNFYQNHRRYVKSRSDVQLSGTSLSAKQTLGDCSPWETFADHFPSKIDAASIPTSTPLSQLKLNPCGLIANSQFNDTLSLYSGVCRDATECSAQTPVSWTNKGIAWASDKEKKFHNLDGFNGTATLEQQTNVEDEDFIVWMRTAGLPTFKKLYRIVNGGLKQGNYTMAINQNFPVKSFDGKKAFYLSTVTWIGGKNDFLGWAYVVVGIICLVLALAFFIKDKLHPRNIGDPRGKN